MAEQTPTRLTVRRVPIDTHSENVAFLRRDCPLYQAEGLRALTKIEVKGGRRHLLATLNIVEANGEPGLILPHELGLSTEAFERLGLSSGEEITLEPAPPPRSLTAVREKINGAVLPPEAYQAIVEDISNHRYSRMELAAFLVAAAGFMTSEEVLALTRAMISVGTRLDWKQDVVVDKHCIGGIPGNRTTMLVVPIVAAHGLTMPKTSSRAITSPAGTADTMEVLCNVNLDMDAMRRVIAEQQGCLIWGGHMRMAPADDIMISVERPLGIDTQEQMVASILSKKVSAGSTHLLIDIPMGPQAKVKSQVEAVRLRKMFEYVGGALGLTLDIVITDGRQPIGRGIGPVLEARDVMQVLRQDENRPRDLEEKAIMLAGRIIDFDPAVRGGEGEAIARAILSDGRALAKMEAIMQAQGTVAEDHCLGTHTRDVLAPADGEVVGIDCAQLNHIARLAGCPMDKGAGIDLFVRVGDRVRKGAALYRIHACRSADFGFATQAADETSGIVLG
jgi:thymidine phosphorylase